MSKVKLDERLMTVANMVRHGGAVADIGTDHAYLPVYLVENGTCSSAFACDVKEMPLKNAENTIRNAGLSHLITPVLADGLSALEKNSVETVVIAGMGGNLIEKILSECDWIKNKNVDLILQPMTHPELVRSFLISNGFEIVQEKGCFFRRHSYCVMLAAYTGKNVKREKGYCYYGELPKNNDELSRLYITKQYERLKKRYNAISKNKSNEEECMNLFEILSDFKNNTEVSTVTVKEVSDFIDSIAPYGTKCDWDNCGLLVGKSDSAVSKIGFCLDLTTETLRQAVRLGVDLMVTHHPAIFHAKKNFTDNDPVFEAAINGVNVISAHTCFDCAKGGVNDVLCEILSLSQVKKIPSDECSVPMVRMGILKEPLTAKELAGFVSEKLGTTVRLVSANDEIKNVAVCGGAGMSFLYDVKSAGADAYVTGDISHHEMLEAKENGITVVAAGHFETEYPAMKAMMSYVSNQFPAASCVLLKQDNPIEFIG